MERSQGPTVADDAQRIARELEKNPFLTVREAREEYFPNRSMSRVTQLVNSGTIPSVRLSPRRILIPRRGLEEMIDQSIAESHRI